MKWSVRACLRTSATLAALALWPATMPADVAVAQPAEPAEGPGCHPSYVGWCVPIGVSDVDCLGGNGNGPYYVGRVRVVGPDVYGLDADHDGIGCENSPRR